MIINLEKARMDFATDELDAELENLLFEKADDDFSGWDGEHSQQFENEMRNTVLILN
jgi:hypothetical protein